MYHGPDHNPELHRFPLTREMEGVDFVDLSTQAQMRLDGTGARITPLERSDTLSYGSNSVYIKRADHLPGGCFKFLSAMNAVAELLDEGHDDLVFATAGSYGIGAGYAINTYGGNATAFVPNGSNPQKQEIMRELGVEVVELEDCNNFDEANEHARQHAEREGVAYLHPFASRANIAGTGILGLELDEQLPDMTHLAVQFGGGSLESGLGSVVKQLRPDVHVAAVQVFGCSPFVDSVRSGEVREAADLSSHIMPSFFARLGGVGVGRTHPLTLGVGSRAVDSVDTVTSGSVYATMHDVQQEHGVLPEFAGAVGLEMARKLARSRLIEGANIVAVLTGNHADEYRNNYLERKSSRRRQEEG